MPSGSRESAGFISSPARLIDRFASTRTTVPHSASPHGATSTSRLPLAVTQRPSGLAARAGRSSAEASDAANQSEQPVSRIRDFMS